MSMTIDKDEYRKITNERLLKAVSDGEIDRVEKHLNNEADINAQNSGGSTSLWLSIRLEHRNITSLLLQKKADPNIVGTTTGACPPIILAIKNADIQLVKALIKIDADVNLPERTSKNTPLICALEIGYCREKSEIIKLLVDAGADIDTIRNAKNKTAMDICKGGQMFEHESLFKIARKIQKKSQSKLKEALHKAIEKESAPQFDVPKKEKSPEKMKKKNTKSPK